MTTQAIARVSARSLFVEPENILYIHDMIRSGGRFRIPRDQLLAWYDSFIVRNNIELSKIEDVRIWADYCTERFIAEWKGRKNVSSEDVPYLPYDVSRELHPEVEMPVNARMIKKENPSGRFPKFNLPSAVEDGVGYDGKPIVHEEHQTIRIFQPLTSSNGYDGKGFRFGKKDPQVTRKIAGHRGHLYDETETGTLYDWELLGRKHTPYPMQQFFTRDSY